MTPIELDRAFLSECFYYEPETGAILWKSRPLSHFKNAAGRNVFNAQFAGMEAGNKAWRRGGVPHHIRIEIRIPSLGRSVNLTAHRIIMTLMGVDIGCHDVDHKNGNPFDNRFNNLRLADKFGSSRNRGQFKRNGKPRPLPKGVRQDGPSEFVARIGGGGKTYLGAYPTAAMAAEAYERAASKMFGEFKRGNA